MNAKAYIKSNPIHFLNGSLLEAFIEKEAIRLAKSTSRTLVHSDLTARFEELNRIYLCYKNKGESTEMQFYALRVERFVDEKWMTAANVLDSTDNNEQDFTTDSLKKILSTIYKINTAPEISIEIPIKDNGAYTTESLDEVVVVFWHGDKEYKLRDSNLSNLLRKVSNIIGLDVFCKYSTVSEKSIKKYYTIENNKVVPKNPLSSDANIKILMNVLLKTTKSIRIYGDKRISQETTE